MRTLLKTLLIAVALVLAVELAACAGEPAKNSETTADLNTEAVSTGSPETTSLFINDDLPADLNYGGKVCRVLYWNDAENREYFADGITGELVNDAIYERNLEVESRLGIKFDFVGEKGSYYEMNTFFNHLNNSMKAGEHAYDIASSYSMGIALLTYNGLCMALQDNQYIDYEKPWWPDALLGQATINGNLYFVSGDLSTNMLYMMYITYFNKQFIADLGLESPYDLVSNNQWTIDKMFEMGQNAYNDLNGNGKFDENDRMAQLTSTIHIEAFFWGSGIRTVDRDASGKLVVSDLYSSERAINVINKISAYFNTTNCAMIGGSPRAAFDEGRTLFHTDRADVGVSDINSGMEYGIVPVCKYDSQQESYYTILGNPFSLYCIPADASDGDMSGAVLECLASEGYRTITPALFETTMKIKYAFDDTASQMYDIVRQSTVYDLGRIFSPQLGSAFINQYRSAVSSNSGTWASASKVTVKTVGKSLEKLQSSVGG
jgi:hypothetical protein